MEKVEDEGRCGEMAAMEVICEVEKMKKMKKLREFVRGERK